jgi:hypothetical protein
MRKALTLLIVTVCTAFIGLVSPSPATALGGESLGCAVFPSSSNTYHSGRCTNLSPASSYGIDFRVLNGSGTYSYAWSVPSEGQIHSGCTSTSFDCWVYVSAETYSVYVTESVVLTQNGSSVSLTATADIEPWCNGQPC